MQNEKETVLVTGATGFLGEYLVRRLAGEYRVLAMGRNAEKGKRLEELGAVFCPGDFTDKKSCKKYFQNVRYVIHAGALSSVWGSWEDFYRTNVLGTKVVAQMCRNYGVKRLVYVSSPSIYSGTQDRCQIREEQAPEKNELNYYIKSKLMAEHALLREQPEKQPLEIVILRPRGLIGIGDTSLVPRLLRANSGIGIPLFRGGKNLVDMTSVENVALACRLAMTAEGAAGQVFNITNGEPTEFKVLLEQFLRAAGEEPHYKRLPFSAMYCAAAMMEGWYRLFRLPGEPALTRYTVCTLGFSQTMDISRAEKILGYRPEKTLKESISEYGAWWKAQKERNREEYRKERGPSLITEVKLYHCGSCTNNLAVMFRGKPWEKRRFPAMAARLRHKELGDILYDTGYSEQIFRGGLPLKLYRFFNPVELASDQTIAAKLAADGIRTEDIGHIILSHAHPDHIGGISACKGKSPAFSGYELTATGEVLAAIKKPRLHALTFSGMLPEKKCISRLHKPEKRLTDHFLCQYFEQVYDLFGDGSIIGVQLEGHCKGQLGVWIPDMSLFLAADACWGRDLIRETSRMRLIPRLIQNNYKDYKDTLRRICRLKREHPEIRIVFSHDRGREKSYG